MPKWNPQLYLKYGNERTQPSIDLAARIAHQNPTRVVDLGCGPGNSTRILKAQWPKAQIMGLDSSSEMIKQAAEIDSEMEWILADIVEWKPDKCFDIIFSNAALQWVPHHQALFPSLIEKLNVSGVLAVQVPYHYKSRLHDVIWQVSKHADWTDLMEGARNALTSHDAYFYYDILSPICRKVDIWYTEYFHQMESPTAILQWISGTGLRPFLETLSSMEDQERFKKEVLAGYVKAYPRQVDGKVLFPFKRQFIMATK